MQRRDLLTGAVGLAVSLAVRGQVIPARPLAIGFAAGQPQVATPTFSPSAGSYGSTQTVTISCSTPSSTIYYTTDGSTPTTGSTVYTTALTVSATTTVKAIATAAGYTQSAVGSATYTISMGPAWAPNLPTGLSAIVDRQWNPTDGSIPGGVLPPSSLSGTDSYDMEWFAGSPAVVPLINTPVSLTSTIGSTIPALPDANPTCMAIEYTSAFPSGNLPFGVFKTGTISVTQMYISCWACIPSGFSSNSNNIKWVFFAQNATRNHVVMLSSGASGAYVGPWVALQGGGGSFNVGGNNNTKSGAITNLSNANLPSLEGTWACFEWLMQLESVPGSSADGIIKFWVNNQLRGYWDNITFNESGSSLGFDTLSFEPFYGGGGSAAPSTQWLCIGRFYAAGA